MNTLTKSVTIHIRVAPPVARRVRQRAHREGVTVSRWVRTVLRQYLHTDDRERKD